MLGGCLVVVGIGAEGHQHFDRGILTDHVLHQIAEDAGGGDHSQAVIGGLVSASAERQGDAEGERQESGPSPEVS